MPAVRKTQGAERPGAAPVGHGAIEPTRVQRQPWRGEVDRKADVTEIEQGRVDDETDILQHGVEIRAPQAAPGTDGPSRLGIRV